MTDGRMDEKMEGTCYKDTSHLNYYSYYIYIYSETYNANNKWWISTIFLSYFRRNFNDILVLHNQRSKIFVKLKCSYIQHSKAIVLSYRLPWNITIKDVISFSMFEWIMNIASKFLYLLWYIIVLHSIGWK